MSIATMGDLLDRAREFEIRLEAYYSDIRDRSRDNGVRLLTYYLIRHRRHQDQALANYGKHQIRRLRRIRLKHEVAFDPEKLFNLLDTHPERVSGEELLRAAADYDQALVNLYLSIAEQPITDEVRTLLESLIRIEERDIAMIKKNDCHALFLMEFPRHGFFNSKTAGDAGRVSASVRMGGTGKRFSASKRGIVHPGPLGCDSRVPGIRSRRKMGARHIVDGWA